MFIFVFEHLKKTVFVCRAVAATKTRKDYIFPTADFIFNSTKASLTETTLNHALCNKYTGRSLTLELIQNNDLQTWIVQKQKQKEGRGGTNLDSCIVVTRRNDLHCPLEGS